MVHNFLLIMLKKIGYPLILLGILFIFSVSEVQAYASIDKPTGCKGVSDDKFALFVETPINTAINNYDKNFNPIDGNERCIKVVNPNAVTIDELKSAGFSIGMVYLFGIGSGCVGPVVGDLTYDGQTDFKKQSLIGSQVAFNFTFNFLTISSNLCNQATTDKNNYTNIRQVYAINNSTLLWPTGSYIIPEIKLKSGCFCYSNNNYATPSYSTENSKDKGACMVDSKVGGVNVCHFFAEGVLTDSYAKGEKIETTPPPETTGSASPGEYKSSNEATKNWIKENYKMPPGYKERDGIIPECAFSGTCENVNDLLQLGINIGKYVFSIIGSVAFLAFVYGGFTIVFSFGSAEKVKKGTEVLIAAVTGMAIAFGAYMLINFILDAMGVVTEFRGIK